MGLVNNRAFCPNCNEAADRLGVTPAEIGKSVARLPRGIRASGIGRKRRLERI